MTQSPSQRRKVALEADNSCVDIESQFHLNAARGQLRRQTGYFSCPFEQREAGF
jgi:hypothetical protein